MEDEPRASPSEKRAVTTIFPDDRLRLPMPFGRTDHKVNKTLLLQFLLRRFFREDRSDNAPGSRSGCELAYGDGGEEGGGRERDIVAPGETRVRYSRWCVE